MTGSERIGRGFRRVGISLLFISGTAGVLLAAVFAWPYFELPIIWCSATSSYEVVHPTSSPDAEFTRLSTLCPQGGQSDPLGIRASITRKEVQAVFDGHASHLLNAARTVAFGAIIGGLLWGLCELMSWMIRGFMRD